MDSQLDLHDDQDIENDSIIGTGNRKELDSSFSSCNISWLQTTWIILLFTSNIILIFLSLPEIFSHHKDNNKINNTLYFATNFTENQSLKSIDHKYDHLWEELVPSVVGLFPSQSVGHGEEDAGVMSM